MPSDDEFREKIYAEEEARIRYAAAYGFTVQNSDVARIYLEPGAQGQTSGPLPGKNEVVAYIREAAIARGIDPDIAVKVAASEGLNANPDEAWQSHFIQPGGKRERSYGPFQLYIDDLLYLFQSKLIKDDNFVHTVYKFWSELRPQSLHYVFAHFLVIVSR